MAKTIEEVINIPVFDILPSANDQGFDKLLIEVFNTGLPYYANEIPYMLPELNKEKLRLLNVVYEPFKDNYRKIEGVMSLSIDVTE